MPAPAFVALETTLLLHGVPPEAAKPLAAHLSSIVREHGAVPRLVGIVNGRPIVGMTDDQLDALLATRDTVRKVNTANVGVALFRGRHAATTVSTTMEFAARAGLHVFATGGIGGVHRGAAASFDISADLTALTRFPVAVVASGVKSILDVAATREMLETLGVPVIGFRTNEFPAFYFRSLPRGISDGGMGLPAHVSGASPEGLGCAAQCSPEAHATPSPTPHIPVDHSFDDPAELARFVRFELARTGRGILICNPIPAEHEINPDDWNRWLAAAQKQAANAAGRDATPALLGALHQISGGATLKANIELVCSNAALAAQVAAAMRHD